MKFGDGSAANVYHRANPNYGSVHIIFLFVILSDADIMYRYVENHLAPSQTLSVVTYDTSTAARQPGKWLEWIHIRITGGVQVCKLLGNFRPDGQMSDFVTDHGTEWHSLQVKYNQNNQALRTNLCNMLNIFPHWNRWSETGYSDQSTTNFENLVDSTWYSCSAEAIARFSS